MSTHKHLKYSCDYLSANESDLKDKGKWVSKNTVKPLISVAP